MARNVEKPSSGTQLDKLWETLRFLRETQSETRQALYNKIFFTLGYSKYPDTYVAEAFLIKTANTLYGEFTTDADTALMALGLLDGYDYNSAKSANDRRIKFLKESMYLAQKGKGSYSDADEDTRLNYISNLRATDEYNLLLEMANFMLKPQNHSQEFISDIDKYIDDGVAVFPIPGYIKRKPLRDRKKKAVITFSSSKQKLFTASSDIIINKDDGYEMTIDLPTDVSLHKKGKISMLSTVIFLLFFTSLSITTIIYTQKNTLDKSQEPNMEYQTGDDTGRSYQTKDDIMGVLERTGQKLEVRPYTLDSSSENGNTVSPF